MWPWNWEKTKIALKKFEQVKMFVFISWKKQVKMLVFISWLVAFGVCIHRYNISVRTPRELTPCKISHICRCAFKRSSNIRLWAMLYVLELIKGRSKVQEKNMSSERGLNFDQWKMFSENYKPMRVWLWFDYKFTENYRRLRLFSVFIQTKNRYPTALDKIRILTWKLLATSS